MRFHEMQVQRVAVVAAACIALLAACASAPQAPAQHGTSTAAAPDAGHHPDFWVTTKVKSSMLAISVNQGVRVHVTTDHGRVTIAGTVSTQDIADQFKQAAARVFGVVSLDATGLVAEAEDSSKK